MSEIALYNLLRRIPDVSDEEAKAAVAYVTSAKGVATKSDIKDMATKSDVEKMGRIMIMWMVALFFGQAIFMFNVLKFFLPG